MQEINFAKTKYNICWVSMIVIFMGTIVYPVVLQSSSEARKERIADMLSKRPVVTVSPTVSLTNNLPETSEEGPESKPSEENTNTTISGEEAFVFTRDLKSGDRGEDVKKLQEYLNARGFYISSSGPGSLGNETDLFGAGTREALIKFQEAHKDILLAPFGLEKGTGYFGETTRNFVNS